MKQVSKFVAFGLIALSLGGMTAPAWSMNHGNHEEDGHGTMDHGSMDAGTMPGQGADSAEVKAKINSVDAENSMMNVSHGPVESLGWPAMTMDLPVTKRVDLSAVNPGDDVVLSLKQGRDMQFRVIGVEKQ